MCLPETPNEPPLLGRMIQPDSNYHQQMGRAGVSEASEDSGIVNF